MIDAAKNLGRQTGKIILICLTAVLGLFVLLAFLRFGFIYWIYSMVEDWAAVRLGFDYYVSNLIATVFASVFSLLTPALAWYIFLGKKQAQGIGAIVGIQLLMCVSIYTLGSGVCFDRRTGKPLCFYADTPNGRVWSYTPGFDPASGKELKLYTREIKETDDRQKISPKSSEPQSRVSPAPPPASEYVPPPFQTAVLVKPQTSPQKNIAPPPESSQTAKPATNHAADPSYERDLELERIRQEETRRQTLENERRQTEERSRREEENYRISAEQIRLEREQKAEQMRLEREQKAEQTSLAHQERERQIAREREEQRRREEKERQKRETVKTIVNVAQPIIERLTRRRN